MKKKDRPAANLENDNFDKAITLLCIGGLVMLFAIPTYYYHLLPEVIPHHFDLKGAPDQYGHKRSIWLLPVIGIIIFLLLNHLRNKPETFNYPIEMTEENALFLYKSARRMVLCLNTFIILSFGYITFITIQTSLGKYAGLPIFFLLSFLLGLFTLIGYFYWDQIKHREL